MLLPPDSIGYEVFSLFSSSAISSPIRYYYPLFNDDFIFSSIYIHESQDMYYIHK